MPKKVLNSVKTTGLGFAPILKYFFDKCSIQEIIDENVPLDPRRKKLSHIQASQTIFTEIFFQVMQLYKICQFASETTVLNVIQSGIAPEEYFDDRLADSLDAIFNFGIGNLGILITRNMISVFNIENDICHNDTISVSTFGDCDNNKREESIKFTFGYSKKHRQDLKQFVWSISVGSGSGLPLFQKAYSGNTADVNTYVEQWHNLIKLLGKRDFLYVADSKIITSDNIAHIHDNDGFFIAPAQMMSHIQINFLKLSIDIIMKYYFHIKRR